MVPPWRLDGAVDFRHALANDRARAVDEVTLVIPLPLYHIFALTGADLVLSGVHCDPNATPA